MIRFGVCLVVMSLFVGAPPVAIAQSAPAAAKSSDGGARPSRIRLTMDKLKAMKASWSTNKPKMKACRQEARAKGLAGDDRWFYMEDCMGKS
jgi:hypothetical protein